MSNLANQLARQEAEEVSRGVRLLLVQPLLTTETDEDGFDLLRRRRGPIVRWFEYYCGWRVVVEPRLGYARLTKISDRPDATRPARRLRSSRAPFDRRRYTLLCLVAAELLAGPVTTIGVLADRVVQASAAETEVRTFDPTHRDERSAYVDVLKWLERTGAVRSVDGATDAYVDHADAKVLYEVDTTLLVGLLAAPVSPSRLSPPPVEDQSYRTPDVADLVVERRYGSAVDPAADPDAVVSDTQRNLWLRHSIMRRLMDDPVVYRRELTPAQLGYLASPTGRRLIQQGVHQAGCVLEERAEGYLVIDPDGIATDIRFPDDSTHAKVAALHLLDRLGGSANPVPAGELVLAVEELLGRFRSWAKAYQSDGGAERLVDDGVAILCAVGLAERHADGAVLALPAAARYAVERVESREVPA
ncbi:TIGR02678 family protein [Actinophytocola xanthii]|uniref:TIGR02678 family protein n=1 Tax=Actinophytocola xanthii TaxID=1912961 RepID=A0A1Q8BYX5_9PSEU|nr:TIGR02678 family protein [Actinophytocola xanthii]OLF07295.1 TIGR02678 family protein [Actinophytocola xanthii]OLF07459.1 TIGR02678 family protein [Actinophytocola xanthii]